MKLEIVEYIVGISAIIFIIVMIIEASLK